MKTRASGTARPQLRLAMPKSTKSSAPLPGRPSKSAMRWRTATRARLESSSQSRNRQKLTQLQGTGARRPETPMATKKLRAPRMKQSTPRARGRRSFTAAAALRWSSKKSKTSSI